ncbi:MAG: hypothetical protein H8E82_02350 [Candidatus Marinimicrobia bacterium]|nr:hypothetical protein [Candidatus Neomarinimicrobiota bacterium]
MSPTSQVWMIMSGRIGIPSFLISLVCFFFLTRATTLNSQNLIKTPELILDHLVTSVADTGGLVFKVQWYYEFEGDSWTGEGTLQILGKDYLKLELPYQEVLIQKSTIMMKYPETDQLIIDHFNRQDPSNIFALFLGEFDLFYVKSAERVGTSLVELLLVGKTMVGFDTLRILVDENSWLPQLIYATAGEDIQVSIQINRVLPLNDPELLIQGEMTAGEIIDLRE